MADRTAGEVEGIFRRRAGALNVPGATPGIDDGEGVREFALGIGLPVRTALRRGLHRAAAPHP